MDKDAKILELEAELSAADAVIKGAPWYKDIEILQEEKKKLIDRIKKLEAAARALRNAQKAYMANRGNQEFGKQVAVKAKELDLVLESE
jgi:hypothetical protein